MLFYLADIIFFMFMVYVYVEQWDAQGPFDQHGKT